MTIMILHTVTAKNYYILLIYAVAANNKSTSHYNSNKPLRLTVVIIVAMLV